MRLGVRSLNILNQLLPIICAVAVIELITARIMGRISFLFAGNDAVRALYEVGLFAIRVNTLLVFASLILLALTLMHINVFTRIVSLSLIAIVPIALLLPYYTYPTALLLVLTSFLLLIKTTKMKNILISTPISLAFILTLSNMLFINYSIMRLLAEISTIIASIMLFLHFNRQGSLSFSSKLISIVIPAVILVAPKYTIPVMPWTIRQVSSFSLGFLLYLPLEIYAASLALLLLTFFRVKQPMIKYGIIMLFLGGLPHWDIYPLLLSLLGYYILSYGLAIDKAEAVYASPQLLYTHPKVLLNQRS